MQQHRPLQQIKNKKNNQPVENKNKKQSTTRTKLKWIFHPAGEEMAKNGAVKNKGWLPSGDPEEKQKATINLCSTSESRKTQVQP